MQSMQSIIVYLKQQLILQRDSQFLWIPVFVGAGIITYFSNMIAISPELAASLLVQVGIAAILCRSFYNHNKFPTLNLLSYYLLLTITFFLLGITSASIRDYSTQTPLVEKDQFVEIRADIKSITRVSGGKAKRVLLENIDILDDNKDLALETIRLRSYHFKGNDWSSGDRVQITAKLLAPSEPIIPNGFDFRTKARFDGLSATGFTIKDAILIKESKQNTLSLQLLREKISHSVYNVLDPDIAGIALALLTGERSGIDKDDNEAMRVSGLAHILAISGLHIGLVAGCVFFFVRLLLSIIPNLALHYPIKKWAAGLAILVAFMYMILAGGTVPTIRAFTMTALVLTAIILDRSAINLRLVAVAALIIMILTPETILGPSFQLSFAAVIALIAFYQGAGRQWLTNGNSYHPAWRSFYYLAGIIATTVIATLATAPFTISFFNRIALFSVFSNILAMPLMTFLVMPFGLLALILMPFGLSDLIWPIMGYGIENIITIARAIADYEYADLYMPSLSSTQQIIIGIGFVFLVLWRGNLRWLGGVAIFLILLANANTHFHRIYIDDKSDKALIVNTDVDAYYQFGRIGRYAKKQWMSDVGTSPLTPVNNIPSCDDFMCVYKTKSYIITFLKNPMFVSRACELSDIIIANFPINDRQCRKPSVIIDRFDSWKHGVHMIEFNEQDYRIFTVR
jgi:competence protein ComEC